MGKKDRLANDYATGLDMRRWFVCVGLCVLAVLTILQPFFYMSDENMKKQPGVIQIVLFLMLSLAMIIAGFRKVRETYTVFYCESVVALQLVCCLGFVVKALCSNDLEAQYPTVWFYLDVLISSVLIARMFDWLNPKQWEEKLEKRRIREEEDESYRKKRACYHNILCSCAVFILIPFIIWFGVRLLNDRSYYFIALLIILLAMVPFFAFLEVRKPKARELVMIAVMSALAVAGRTVFYMLPQFKPMMAIVIITGIGLGAEAGFLTGALSAFVSNFFFGQGPWTPWQMFAFGVTGFFAGVIFYEKKNSILNHKITKCIYGAIATLVIYGGIMDSASVLMYSNDISLPGFLAMYVSGIPFNLIHAASTVVFLFILEKPILKKIRRVKMKF